MMIDDKALISRVERGKVGDNLCLEALDVNKFWGPGSGAICELLAVERPNVYGSFAAKVGETDE